MEHQNNNDILTTSNQLRENNLLLESQRAFAKLDSPHTSLDDVQGLVDKMAVSNPNFRNNLLAFQWVNSDVIKLHLVSSNESHFETSKLQLFQQRLQWIKTWFSNIQKVYNESTTLANKWIDVVIWTFWWDTAEDSFKSSFASQKLQVKSLISQLQNEIHNPSLDWNLKQQYSQILSECQALLTLQLEDVSFSQMTDNHLNTLPDSLQPTAYALKWEVIGIAQWVEWVITGSVELLKFMVMYPFSAEYRKEFNTQAEQIFDFCAENWFSWMKDVVVWEIQKEMERISKLPRNQQSEAIWKIAGTVISALMAIKAAGMVGDKIWKMAQAKRMIKKAEAVWNTQRVEKIKNIVAPLNQHKTSIHTANTILTWVAESGLAKWASKVKDTFKVGKNQSDLKSTLVWSASHLKWHQESQWVKSASHESVPHVEHTDDGVRKLESQEHTQPLSDADKKKIEIQKINKELIPQLHQEFKEHKEIAEILEKYILDEAHPMDIVKYLQNSTTRAAAIQSLKEIIELWKNAQVPKEEFAGLIKSINLWKESSFLKLQNFNHYETLQQSLLQKNPDLYGIWNDIKLPEWVDLKDINLMNLSLPYKQKKALFDYAKVLPEVNIQLKATLQNIAQEIWIKDGFPSVSTRAKSAGWLLEKINRMREWNAGRDQRPNYKLWDIPDAVWWRLTVKDVNQLEQVLQKIEQKFWKENIFEIENFYSSDKKLNKPYRVITMTVQVDGVPCEIQLSTLKSSLMADLDHNVIYKEIHEASDEVKENLIHLNRQTTIEEHSLIK